MSNLDNQSQEKSKAQTIRDFISEHPRYKNPRVVEELGKIGFETTTSYVYKVRTAMKKKKTTKPKGKSKIPKKAPSPKYPRHSLKKVLRVPQAILDQNAGKECSVEDAAAFVGVKLAGPFQVEISSAIKYGLLERPSSGRLRITELAKMILRPTTQNDELKGLRTAVSNAPDISSVYSHYRGENLPDPKFFNNALVENFGIPVEKVNEFSSIFHETLKDAKLIEQHQDKIRVLDISDTEEPKKVSDRIKKLGREVKTQVGDSCFVVMPFAPPHGDYYAKIFEPAIQKAGLVPVRADNEIFGAGKIMDQIWRGITDAKVLVAELTTRNANVFYELGLAHALKKPVVLVSSNQEDVPFDLQHIRVIYYDVMDPFWGQKLMDKVAENILSAIKNPEEAIFQQEDQELNKSN